MAQVADARIGPLGDSAVAIELGQTIDPATNVRVHVLDRLVSEAGLPGVLECVPAYASVLVHYDPLHATYGELVDVLGPIVAATPGEPSRATGADTVVEVPVAYGGDAGPDLSDVARSAGMSEGEVVRRHAAGEYRVAMIGFAPGFPYLMGMDPALACPRLESPRVRVPGGSVGIADTQTGIYPFAMPGGWRLIGRTVVRLFDPLADPPALLGPGRLVRFVPLGHEATQAADHPVVTRERTGSGARAMAQDHGRAVRVLEAGFLTTIQDGGRPGFQRFGVPPSGAADVISLAVGNEAVGNEPGTAALEVTAGGTALEFLTRARVALTGALVDARLGERAVPFGEAIAAHTGDVLHMGRPRDGLRTYVCLDGGVDVPAVLGSRSTYLPAGFGGLEGRPLRAGDVLALGSADLAPEGDQGRGVLARFGSPAPPGPLAGRPIELPFVPGGQWDSFGEDALRAFLRRTWQVSHRSDRIGLRLEGEPLATDLAGRSFVTDATVSGAVQVAGDGLPIVLGVDRQTTGGYPKLGAVASVGLHLLGQAQPGDEIRFRTVSVAEAQRAWRALHRAAQRTRG